MYGFPDPEWISRFSPDALAVGMSVLTQTTAAVFAGLLLALALRRRGAAVQSLVLRVFLVAAFLAWPLSAALNRAGVPGISFRLPMPLHSVSAPVPSPAPHPAAVPVRPSPTRPDSPAADAPSAPSRPFGETAGTRPVITPRPPASSQTTPSAPSAAGSIARFILLLPAAWAICSVLFLARILVHFLAMNRIRRNSVAAKPSSRAICLDAARLLGVRPPRVLQSTEVRSPLLTGVFRPCILLPLGGAEEFLDERSVFLHELAHLKRHDTLWNLAARVAVALLPFQPLLWVLARWIEETADYACDDYVARFAGERRSYAETLLAVARSFLPASCETTAGVGIISFRSSLRRRVERVLDTSRTLTLRVGGRMLVFVYALCLCVTFLSGLIGFRGKSFAQAERAVEALRRDGVFAAVREQLRAASRVPAPESPGTGIPGRDPGPSAGAGPEENIPPENSTGEIALRPDEADPSRAETMLPAPDFTAESFPADSGAPDHPAPSPKTSESVARADAPSGKASAPDSGHTPATDSLLRSEPGALLAAVLTSEAPAAAKPGPLEIDIPETLGAGALREKIEQGQENPVWSPSGKVIAFTGRGGYGIWAVAANGGKPALLFDNSRSGVISASAWKGLARILGFTPDGRELTFVNYAPETAPTGAAKESSAGALTPNPVIESVNLDTGERRVIVEEALDGCWSRDGRYFVYVESDFYGINILDTAAGTRRAISPTGFSPTLTHDGAAIIYVDQAGFTRNQLFRIPLAGGEPEKLTEDGSWWEPKCSPDGEWVLCSGNAASQYNASVHFRAFNLHDRQSYDVLVFADNSAGIGSWSPSGRQFCYTRSIGVFQNGYNVRRSTIHIGDFPLGSAASVTETKKPREFKLVGNFPNPFNPSTTIRFILPSAGSAELTIYNMMGQKIRELVSGRMEAGEHAVMWNGRDQENRPASSGIYVARLKMEGKVETRRMTLVK